MRLSCTAVGRVTLAVTMAGCSIVLVGGRADAAPAPTTAAARITFGVQPATRASFDSTRSDFSYSATPGARINDYVALRNYADKPVTLRTYPGDAYNTDSGAYDVLKSNQKSTDLGAWIGLGSRSVTVPGRANVIVPFQIQVPASATPGDHDAGIVAAIVTQQLRSNGSKVTVEERVGARVHIRVSGPLRPSLLVRQLKTSYSDSLNPIGAGSLSVSYQVINTGNVRLSATQQVEVHSLIGGNAKPPKLLPIPELLPGNSINQRVVVTGVWPGLRVKATVVLVPHASKTTPVPGLVPVRQASMRWAIPWTLVGSALVLFGLVFLVRWLRRRRAAASLAAKPAPRRELVGAGTKGGSGAPQRGRQSVPARADDGPIDLRDPLPLEVDLRESTDDRVVDLGDQPVANPDQDGGNTPPPDSTRK
jgi:hypothetical protein